MIILKKRNNSRPGLKKQFITLFIILFLMSGLVILSVVYFTLNNKTKEIGRDYAVEYALKEKNRLMAPIQKEIALSRKMADSPLLIKWAKNEKDTVLREMALQELENFRKHFSDQRYFFVIDKSKNYYFNNSINQYHNDQ
ncbi:hypothetical protein [Natronospora cellulosivora (SeqCode)]